MASNKAYLNDLDNPTFKVKEPSYIEVIFTKRLRFRIWLAMKFIWLATWILGGRLEMVDEDELEEDKERIEAEVQGLPSFDGYIEGTMEAVIEHGIFDDGPDPI